MLLKLQINLELFGYNVDRTSSDITNSLGVMCLSNSLPGYGNGSGVIDKRSLNNMSRSLTRNLHFSHMSCGRDATILSGVNHYLRAADEGTDLGRFPMLGGNEEEGSHESGTAEEEKQEAERENADQTGASQGNVAGVNEPDEFESNDGSVEHDEKTIHYVKVKGLKKTKSFNKDEPSKYYYVQKYIAPVTVNQETGFLATSMMDYIINGSKLHQITVDMLRVSIPPSPNEDMDDAVYAKQFCNYQKLWDCGNCILDVIFFVEYYRSTGKDMPLSINPAREEGSGPNQRLVSQYLFAYAFFLITRATPPDRNGGKDNAHMPSFIRQTMALGMTSKDLCNKLASFDLANIKGDWIKHIKFNNLDNEARARLMLGVAGYRFIGFITGNTEKAGLSTAMKDSLNYVRKVLGIDYFWDLHPLCRTDEFIMAFKSLNKNLQNLILDCFSKEVIKAAYAPDVKQLYGPIRKHTGYLQYKTWKEGEGYVPKLRIFEARPPGGTGSTTA